MATPKYQLAIYDYYGIPWYVNFYKGEWFGDPIRLKGTGAPINIEYLNDSDDVFAPIKPSQIKLGIVIESSHILRDICAKEIMETYVELTQNEDSSAAEPFWKGYVDIPSYEEPYDVFPHEIAVTCVDGLTLLKDIKYNEDETYTNRRGESLIILDILGELGFTEFKEFINIYEEEMNTDTDDSPSDQQAHHVDVFKDMTCEEVLRQIIGKYNACIRQVDGVFCIYRPVDLIEDIVYGRHFTSSTTKELVSIDPKQFIHRSSTHPTSILRQIPGGIITNQEPAKKIISNFDTGDRESWINNWELKGETWDDDTETFEHWTPSEESAVAFAPLEEYLGLGKDGVYFTGVDTVIPNENYIQQTFAPQAILASDSMVFEFEYAIYNKSSATVNNAAVTIQLNQGTYYASGTFDVDSGYDPTLVTWGEPALPTAYIVVYKDVTEGITGWATARFEIINLPSNGALTIKLCGPTQVNIEYAIKEVRLYARSITRIKKRISSIHRERQSTLSTRYNDAIARAGWRIFSVEKERTEIVYEKENAIKGVELEYNYTLGDIIDEDIKNILEQYIGAIAVSRYNTLALAAAYFVTKHAGDYSDGGVVVTSSGANIIFTAAVAGIDFTGTTSITNNSGDLSGTVVNTQANVALAEQWYSDVYYNVNDICSNDGSNYICLQYHINVEPGTEPGYWSTGTSQPRKRIDTVTLTGTNGLVGSAYITCDGETQQVEMGVLAPSVFWWKAKEGSSDIYDSSGDFRLLLEMMADEIAHQYSRPKQLIDMPIQEMEEDITKLNVIGSFQDTEDIIETGSNLMTDPDGTSTSYSTFVINGVAIYSAICTSASTALSNTFSVTIGETIIVKTYLTLNSGQAPSIAIGANILTIVSNVEPLQDGINEIRLTITESRSDTKLIILNSTAANWSMSDIEIYHTSVRKFVMNRGTFDVRKRQWRLDLIEIIE